MMAELQIKEEEDEMAGRVEVVEMEMGDSPPFPSPTQQPASTPRDPHKYNQAASTPRDPHKYNQAASTPRDPQKYNQQHRSKLLSKYQGRRKPKLSLKIDPNSSPFQSTVGGNEDQSPCKEHSRSTRLSTVLEGDGSEADSLTPSTSSSTKTASERGTSAHSSHGKDEGELQQGRQLTMVNTEGRQSVSVSIPASAVQTSPPASLGLLPPSAAGAPPDPSPMDRSQLLPRLRTPCPSLGLSPVSEFSEFDWSMEEPEEEEGVEDSDVLSLYEFDTMLEGGDDDSAAHSSTGQPRESVNLSRSSIAAPGDQFPAEAINPEGADSSPNHQDKEGGRPSSKPPASTSASWVSTVDQLFRQTEMGPPANPCRKPAPTKERPSRRANSNKRTAPEARRGRPVFVRPLSLPRPHPSKENPKQKLEAELKHFIDEKNIMMAVEVVRRIHAASVEVDRGLVFALLHLLIRQGAVAPLMRVFTFICNHRVFNEEVCNAYIRLACCGDDTGYSKQLSNIYQFARRHGIRPAGDCCTALLRVFSRDREDPAFFWLMLGYFETFHGFAPPTPILQTAIAVVLSSSQSRARDKFNQWVLTTKADNLRALDLAVVGKMAAVLKTPILNRLQRALADPEEEEEKAAFPEEQDLVLVQPSHFQPQHYLFFHSYLKECRSSQNWSDLGRLFVEMCRMGSKNRPVLQDYADLLLQQPPPRLLPAVTAFLTGLQAELQEAQINSSFLELDQLALTHLAARLLLGVTFTSHVKVTFNLLKVMLQCPLIPERLLLSVSDTGVRMLEVCLKCGETALAKDLLKDMNLKRDAQQTGVLVMDLLQKLVASKDVSSALTVLKTAADALPLGWLEPLLGRIGEGASHVVCPSIDVIEDKTLRYQFQSPTSTSVGGFDWNLQFNWHDVPQHEMRRRNNSHVAPIRSPTMAGGLFAIDKAYFYHLGTYDSQMDIWGGENLELSFRVWMCGGSLEILPCSHVGHIFRQWMPYGGRSGVDSVKRNTVRLAEVWVDDYKHYYYQRINYRLGEFGDLSERRQLRQRLGCRDFQWYVDNVYPELPIPGDYVAAGEIRSQQKPVCIDSSIHGVNKVVGAYPCHGEGGNQFWMLTRPQGQIRRDEGCLDHSNGTDVIVYPCHGMGGNQEWRYTQNNSVYHPKSGKCIEVWLDGRGISMKTCTGRDNQLWTWKRKSPTAT